MYQSKLLELLRVLPVKTWRRLGEHLRLYGRADLIAFYGLLEPAFPAFDQPFLEKKRFAQLFEEQIDEKVLAQRMNRLLEQVYRVLALEALQTDEFLEAQLLLNKLRELGAGRHASGVYERACKNLEVQTLRGAAYYRRRFELSLAGFRMTEDPHRHQHRESLQTAADDLEASYLADKLRLLCEMAAQEQLLSDTYEKMFAADLEITFEKSRFAADPALALFYYAWRISTSDDKVVFDHFLAMLREYPHILPDEEQKQLFTYALNFCTRQINRRNDRTYFDTYLTVVDMLPRPELLLDNNGELPPWRYLNLVHAALQNQRWSWAWDFIHNWRAKLPATYAENLHAFNLARWHYAQKQHGEAQQCLATVAFDDPLLSLAARSLHLKLLYETNQEEPLFAALEANRLYLLRAKHLAASLRRQMQQFVDYTRKLAKTHNAARLGGLLVNLPPATEIMHRDWLEEQISLKFKVLSSG